MERLAKGACLLGDGSETLMQTGKTKNKGCVGSNDLIESLFIHASKRNVLLGQWFPTFIKAHTPKISQYVLAPLKYFNMSRAGAILKAWPKLRGLTFFLEISVIAG